MGVEPALSGVYSVGLADRRAVAVAARQVSLAGDLLEAVEAVGGEGCVA